MGEHYIPLTEAELHAVAQHADRELVGRAFEDDPPYMTGREGFYRVDPKTGEFVKRTRFEGAGVGGTRDARLISEAHFLARRLIHAAEVLARLPVLDERISDPARQVIRSHMELEVPRTDKALQRRIFLIIEMFAEADKAALVSADTRPKLLHTIALEACERIAMLGPRVHERAFSAAAALAVAQALAVLGSIAGREGRVAGRPARGEVLSSVLAALGFRVKPTTAETLWKTRTEKEDGTRRKLRRRPATGSSKPKRSIARRPRT